MTTAQTKPLALVTGVGPGTGAAVARRFAEGGYRVAMLARDESRLAALEAEIPGSIAVPCDVSDAAALERAIAIDPAHAKARIALGDALKGLGQIDAAVAQYRKAVTLKGQTARAWYRLANLKTVQLGKDVPALQKALTAAGLHDDERILLGYALSKALDDAQQPQAAFAALATANRIKRSKVKWDATAFSAEMAAVDAAFAQPMRGADDAQLGHEVIFVVSLPRSGSTLTEQILASHPQIEGANELPDLHQIIHEESQRRGVPLAQWAALATPQDWRRLGEQYLERTARWRSEKPRFTDKGLSNWQLIGAAVAMLPGARFVNCRRDPVETCLSCYRQLFARGNYFSYDLAEVGAYWRDYDRLSRAWRQRFPERVFDQVYEELLVDPEAQVRRLLQFLDLPYDPACLEFHRAKRVVRTASAAQVRQPLRRDTARAQRYGAALDPLRVALGVDTAVASA